MPEIKLKPCPFCGGKAKYTYGAADTVAVICCKCKTKSDNFKISFFASAVEEASNAWNKRANKEEALEPEYEGDGYDDKGELIYDMAYCPICHYEYEVDYDTHDNYCRNCGQKLDWRRAENETD